MPYYMDYIYQIGHSYVKKVTIIKQKRFKTVNGLNPGVIS